MGKSQDDSIRDRITGLFKFKSDNTPKTVPLESIVESSCQKSSVQSFAELNPHTAAASHPASPVTPPPCVSEKPRSAHAIKAVSYPPALYTDPHAKGQLHPSGADSVNTAYSTLESLPSQHREEQNDEEVLETKPKEPLRVRFWGVTKTLLCHNISNVLLVFVPVAIAFGAINKQTGENGPISPTVTFVMNAIAIIPLASMLSFATECVAAKLGDTIGALMNVTFGNAVELIIFIALVDNQIAIVQASLLGSILANMLLILGMSFCFGGLRFQEQLYNVRVTQMSAGLLSLSVISLLLPTAFHASFKDSDQANQAVLKISRGTSVILLLIYIIYLLFQLKSHSFIYESTPQHQIDEEAHPGVLADILDSSSSSESSRSSNSSDSEKDNASFLRKALKRARRRRRSSSTSSSSTSATIPESAPSKLGSSTQAPSVETLDRAHVEDDRSSARTATTEVATNAFASESSATIHAGEPEKERRSHRKNPENRSQTDTPPSQATPVIELEIQDHKNSPSVHKVDFATVDSGSTAISEPKRGLPFKLPLFLQPFQNAPVGNNAQKESSTIRRTQSMPELQDSSSKEEPSPAMPARQSLRVLLPNDPTRRNAGTVDKEQTEPPLSRRAAVILLIVSTGLVAACAEFLVESINYLVSHTGISQAFVGLIILPIVGNAAEHVTAVTVACKNKMDLAIAVSIGSSIQIALFVTPVVVLLGWILDTEMSLYFTLFETVCLFVSAFIVNYLVMNGRSNYFQGALMMSTYVIIAVVSFYYPQPREHQDGL